MRRNNMNISIMENGKINDYRFDFFTIGRGKETEVIFEKKEMKDLVLENLEKKESNPIKDAFTSIFMTIPRFKISATGALNLKEIKKATFFEEEKDCAAEFFETLSSFIDRLQHREYAMALVYHKVCRDLGYAPTQQFLKQLLKGVGEKMPRGLYQDTWKTEELKEVAAALCITPKKLDEIRQVAENRKHSIRSIHEGFLRIAEKNINKIFSTVKSKKFIKMSPQLIYNPSKKQFDPYKGIKNFKTDLALTYTDSDGHRVGESLEVFGWTGSKSYYNNQKIKVIASSIDNSVPTHCIITTKKNDVLDLSLPEDKYNDLEASIYKWTLNNCRIVTRDKISVMNAIYIELAKMMSYAGFEAYMPTNVLNLFSQQ